MSISKFSLDGKVALVTGGSRGIGRATALAFAEAGADVVVSSRNLPDLENVAAEIRAFGRRGMAVSAHGGRIEELNNLVSRVQAEFGRIDILVNNAATNPLLAPIIDIEERAWDVIMNVNLKGCFFLSQAVARMMKTQGGGCIINIASGGGLTPEKGQGVYCTSKAGVLMLTKVMAYEWGQYNIRVNAIVPGLIKTKMSQALWEDKDCLEEVLSHTPLYRIGEPDEIANAALFLASEAASFITGDTMIVDGGEQFK